MSRRVVVAGTATTLLLVGAFGNQWLSEDLLTRAPDDEGAEAVLARLSMPHWVIDKSGVFSDVESAYVAGCLLGVAALLVTVALVLRVASRRNGFNPFISGWFSLVLGGAAYMFTAYLVAGGAGHFVVVRGLADSSGGKFAVGSGGRSTAGVVDALASGGGYGLLAGWLVGIVVAFVAAGGTVRTLFRASPPSPPSPPSVPYGYQSAAVPPPGAPPAAYPPYGANRS
ncbi:hypothetical protein [Streptomyces sp. SID3343]|uniref:hypothetical protein n=1 Tax=Streptomyces sp. SID3343 TaxID=2690260 RepID=UPI00136BA54A|nr:hypothetical protein [Streptomyces sp. SID3343]MYW03987.1 hypothetical protein [Streptomyces sp. SID3343]